MGTAPPILQEAKTMGKLVGRNVKSGQKPNLLTTLFSHILHRSCSIIGLFLFLQSKKSKLNIFNYLNCRFIPNPSQKTKQEKNKSFKLNTQWQFLIIQKHRSHRHLGQHSQLPITLHVLGESGTEAITELAFK